MAKATTTAKTETTAHVAGLSADQLQDRLLELKKEQFNLRFQKATGQLQDTARVRVVRRTIAQIKTRQRAGALAAKS